MSKTRRGGAAFAEDIGSGDESAARMEIVPFRLDRLLPAAARHGTAFGVRRQAAALRKPAYLNPC
jgi:hypothetical protein